MFTSPKSQMGKKTKDQQMLQRNKRQATTDGIREISSLRNVLKAYNIFIFYLEHGFQSRIA